MAATLKLLPTEQIPGDAARGWNLTDLLRRVAAEHEQGDGIDHAAAAADIEAAATEAPATTADDATTPAPEAERSADAVEIWLGRIRDQLNSIRPQAVARLKRA